MLTRNKLRRIFELTEITSVEISRRSRVDRGRIWMYGKGDAKLTTAQLEAVDDAFGAAIVARMVKFKTALEILKKNGPGNKVAADGAGAPVNGQESESSFAEHDNAG